MPTLTLTFDTAHPQADLGRVRVEVARGTTVLDAAQSAGVAISTLCGGAMQCKACHVRVHDPAVAGALSPMGRKEAAILIGLGLSPGARLACQAKVMHDACVTVVAPPGGDDDDA